MLAKPAWGAGGFTPLHGTLLTDVPTDAKVRASIVESLLAQCEEGKLFDRGINNYRHYAKLKHPGLVEQLRSYISNPGKQDFARYVAIEIAEVCKISELQNELAELALDSTQSIFLRVSAANAICSIGNAATRLRLKPLAIEQLSEDAGNQLKGYALNAVWPDHLTVEELFQVVTRPKRRNFGGGYQWFLDHELVPQLRPEHLVVALDWLAEQGLRCFGDPFEELGNALLFKAWENFDVSGVSKSFTQVALVQWKENQRIFIHNCQQQEQFASSLFHDSRKRHMLIEQAFLVVSGSGEEASFLLSSLSLENILICGDALWMLEKLQTSKCEDDQKIWAELIERSFNRQDVKQIDAIIAATQTNSVLQELFSPYFVPIELNSSQADKQRNDYVRIRKMQAHRQNPPLLKPPFKERIQQLLMKLESGDLSAWWQLDKLMTLNPESQYQNNLKLDLTQLPGWQDAEEATQRRIIEGAKKYVQEQDDVDYDWVGQNTFNQIAFAGCRALQLLLTESLDFLKNLPLEVWQRWIPVILAGTRINQYKASYLELVKYAYLIAPEVFIKSLMVQINQENKKFDYLYVIERLDKCWNKQLKLALLEKVRDPSLKPKCVGQLLEKLLKQELAEAEDFAKSLITFPLKSTDNEPEIALIASRVLVENSNPSSWPFIWAIIQQDSSFGRELLELVAQRNMYRTQLNLSETQLADLYIWLVHEYPCDEDPDHSDEVIEYSETAEDNIARIRDNVRSQLVERGTLEACTQIQRLIQELPDFTWLGTTLIDAQANMRRKTWQPMTPEELLQFLISQEPSNSDLSNQIAVIDQRTKKMEDEPRIENRISISNSPNSPINAPVGTSGVTNSNVTISSSDNKKGFNWGNWLAVIAIIIAGLTIPLSMSVSGAFNEEFKEWFNRTFYSKVEQQPVPKSE